jgi:hypothetical protein
MATSGDSNQRSAPLSALPQPSSFNTLQFGTMTDSQLRQTITQLSHAASGTHYQAYAAPTPQRTAGKRHFRSLLPPSLILFIAVPAYSVSEKHRQLVYVLDSSTAHGLAPQPRREKQ